MPGFLTRLFGSANERTLRRLWPVVEEVNGLEESFRALPDEAFPEKTAGFRQRLAGVEAEDRAAPLRRPAPRRDRAARGQDRRDEDGGGEDARRHAAPLPERPWRPGRSGRGAAWRRASSPPPSSSRRSCPRAARSRRGAGRRSGAARSSASTPARRWRKPAVFSGKASSGSARKLSSSPLTSSTTGQSRRSVRSFALPKRRVRKPGIRDESFSSRRSGTSS